MYSSFYSTGPYIQEESQNQYIFSINLLTKLVANINLAGFSVPEYTCELILDKFNIEIQHSHMQDLLYLLHVFNEYWVSLEVQKAKTGTDQKRQNFEALMKQSEEGNYESEKELSVSHDSVHGGKSKYYVVSEFKIFFSQIKVSIKKIKKKIIKGLIFQFYNVSSELRIRNKGFVLDSRCNDISGELIHIYEKKREVTVPFFTSCRQIFGKKSHIFTAKYENSPIGKPTIGTSLEVSIQDFELTIFPSHFFSLFEDFFL